MAHRTFVDADGVTWQVWDVHPGMAERRASDRRQRLGAAPPSSPAERRRSAERRKRLEKRVAVRPGYENGWLAFESDVGVRRLAPIPADWAEQPDDALAAWCARATDAPRPRRRLIE